MRRISYINGYATIENIKAICEDMYIGLDKYILGYQDSFNYENKVPMKIIVKSKVLDKRPKNNPIQGRNY